MKDDDKPVSPLPWKAEPAANFPDRMIVVDSDGHAVAVASDVATDQPYIWQAMRPKNAELIVRAVNAHGALVAACRATLAAHEEEAMAWWSLHCAEDGCDMKRPQAEFVRLSREALALAEGKGA